MEEFNSADILKTQNRKKRLAFLEVGLFEISFVLIIIIVLFGTLNYFNILSLSALYPNQLGFLPHQAFTNTKINQKVAISTPNSQSTPIPVSYGENKLSAERIAESKAYVKEKNFASKTSVRQDGGSFAVDGIFSAFGKQQIQLVTADGIMNFAFNSSTAFEQMSLTKTDTDSVNTVFRVSKTYTADTFLQSVPLGGVVQIYYTDNDNSNLSATKIVYYPDLK